MNYNIGEMKNRKRKYNMRDPLSEGSTRKKRNQKQQPKSYGESGFELF